MTKAKKQRDLSIQKRLLVGTVLRVDTNGRREQRQTKICKPSPANRAGFEKNAKRIQEQKKVGWKPMSRSALADSDEMLNPGEDLRLSRAKRRKFCRRSKKAGPLAY
jgi:hypothetical protein